MRRQPRAQQELLVEHLVPEVVDLLGLGEEAVAAEVEAVAVADLGLGDAADLVLGLEDDHRDAALGQQVAGGEPGRAAAEHGDRALATAHASADRDAVELGRVGVERGHGKDARRRVLTLACRTNTVGAVPRWDARTGFGGSTVTTRNRGSLRIASSQARLRTRTSSRPRRLPAAEDAEVRRDERDALPRARRRRAAGVEVGCDATSLQALGRRRASRSPRGRSAGPYSVAQRRPSTSCEVVVQDRHLLGLGGDDQVARRAGSARSPPPTARDVALGRRAVLGRPSTSATSASAAMPSRPARARPSAASSSSGADRDGQVAQRPRGSSLRQQPRHDQRDAPAMARGRAPRGPRAVPPVAPSATRPAPPPTQQQVLAREPEQVAAAPRRGRRSRAGWPTARRCARPGRAASAATARRGRAMIAGGEQALALEPAVARRARRAPSATASPAPRKRPQLCV